MREFPGLVQLHNQYAGQVICLSFNLDFDGGTDRPSASQLAEVRAFAERQSARFTHMVSSETDTAIYERLDLASIPAVLVYGADGKLSKRFDNESNEYGDEGFSYQADIIPYVGSLLESP
ncbi:MAG: hypothetical protein CMJ70_12930 [Planctomycetaceae bacterium]|nr:hypothetical protein [Planctomycetaceae bacterium]HAA71332.1 hypothetical protein [Planctomycetaceae bacterium]